MKCIKCQHDSKLKDRSFGRCPSCSHHFVFNPREKDPFTDMKFQNAILAVSANGEVRWTEECLYYEVCKRARKRYSVVWKYLFTAIALAVGALIFFKRLYGLWVFEAFALILTFHFWKAGGPFAPITREKFDGYLSRWIKVNRDPKGLIQSPQRDSGSWKPKLGPDVADYSFDRAVICDNPSTVDLLIANRFHFENNCAVLGVDGYPAGPFETVRSMLRRNPRLRVFLLHDATGPGCSLRSRIENDRDWFPEGVQIVDVGIRPRQAMRFHGLFQPPRRELARAKPPSVSLSEVAWLEDYSLGLAVFRPEQILKRLFRAIHNAESSDDHGDTGGGGDSSSSSSHDHSGDHDQDSNWSGGDAGDTDSDFDSFG